MNVQGHIIIPLERTGENAVEYRITSSASNLVYFPARGTFSPDSLTVACVRIDGDTSDSYAAYWWVQAQYEEDGDFQTVATTTSASTSYTFQMSSLSQIPIAVRVSAHSATPTAGNQLTGCQETLYTSSQCALRVQNWETVADGFAFECGKVGDTYLDVVIYGNANSYYQCRTNHEKSDSTAPQEGTSSQYWQLVNSFDNIATNVLFANYAKINNLYADDLFMDGTETAIWINPELDGMCVAKKTDDTPLNRADQRADEGLWLNPKVKFAASSLPDVGDIYPSVVVYNEGDTQKLAANYDWQSATITAATTSNTGSSDISGTSVVHKYQQFAVVGKEESIIIRNNSFSVTLIEGAAQTSSLLYSSATIELQVVISGNSQTLGTISLIGSGTATDTVRATFPSQTVTVKNPSTTLEQSASIYMYISYQLRPQAEVTTPQFDLDFRLLEEDTGGETEQYDNYISLFSADGLFVGNNSGNYFRLGIDNAMADIALRSNNSYGLSLNKNGLMQYVNGLNVPMGGTLLTGYIYPSGSSGLTGNIWTWDGNMPTLRYNGTGDYTITFSAALWSEVFGTLSARSYCVTVTVDSGSLKTANVVCDTNNIEVLIYNSSGALINSSFMVRVDLINGQVIYS